MPETILGKTLALPCDGGRFLECLQDPLFWAQLPKTVFEQDVARRPLALGGTVRPAFETLRLTSVTPGNIVFQADGGVELRLADAGREVHLEFRMPDAICQHAVTVRGLAELIESAIEALTSNPHLALLPQLEGFAYELLERKRWIEGRVAFSALIQGVSARAFEESILDPNRFHLWMDPDIESGFLEPNPGWPAPGSTVRYGYGIKVGWLRWPIRSMITLETLEPGRLIAWSDFTARGQVEVRLRIGYREMDEGLRVNVEQTTSVKGPIMRRVLGFSLPRVIPVEAAHTFCRFMPLVSAGGARRPDHIVATSETDGSPARDRRIRTV